MGDEARNSSTQSVNWLDRLKPSSKNKLIQRRYKGLSSEDKESELTKYGIDASSIINTKESFEDQNYTQKWNKCVIQSKFQMLQIDTNNESQLPEDNNENFENSFISDNNLEEINNIIEEKYKIAISENLFLRQENHSIIPFLLIQQKEVHRMCLSDYEIKMVCRSYKDKSKSFKVEAFDNYKLGLIHFYKGKYNTAYIYFKEAYNAKQNDINAAKWLAFAGMILLFCEKNKLDFSNMKNMKINQDKTNGDTTDESFSIFSCCSTRKASQNKISSVQMQILNNDMLLSSNKEFNISHASLANEISELLKLIVEHKPKKPIIGISHEVEAW